MASSPSPLTPVILRTPHASLSILPHGLTIYQLLLPNQYSPHIVLASPSLHTEYPNVNSICGRYANRICKGKFPLNGKEYQLQCNNGPNHLHGGPRGFWSKPFTLSAIHNDDQENEGGRYTTTSQWEGVSEDGEEGYPGSLSITVGVSLWEYKDTGSTKDKKDPIIYGITLDIRARLLPQPAVDRTIVNICNHTYWNLSNHHDGSDTNVVDTHCLRMYCGEYLPIDENMIPTGEIRKVKEASHMDFTGKESKEQGEGAEGKRLNKDIEKFKEVDKQTNGGYDHCFVIDSSNDNNIVTREKYPYLSMCNVDAEFLPTIRLCSELSHPGTGRLMRIYTNAPGIQLYTGNFLSGKYQDIHKKDINKYGAVCLETQRYPDSPNRSEWPSVVLKQGAEYSHQIIHSFHNCG